MKSLLAALLAAVSLNAAFAASPEAVQWTRWELVARTAALPEDSYRSSVSAIFRGPSGRRIDAPAFLSGGAFKIRVAFPAPGVWKWEVASSSPAISFQNSSGTVRVRKYEGTNPLFRRGFLRVHSSNRCLAYADGAPFLWMGDTAWYAGVKATPEEWADYIADRAAKRFSVVHVSAVRGPTGPGAPQPFDAQGRPAEAYWDGLDRKVKEANERGIVILMVGLGRPNDPADAPRVAAPEFARYVAARFFGDHIIFSPNFDGPYQPILDTVAENLRAATALHLITQHPNTRRGQNEIYVPRSYLSFSGLQSGHHTGKLELTYGAAREWALNLWSATPVKPVINIEAMYDGRGNDEGAGWRAKDARKLGWITWLSGALGYSYGAGESGRKVPGTNGGVWLWNQDASTWDFWRTATGWRSSSQMTVLRDFFASLEWWRLEPAHNVIVEPAESNPERGVFASAADRSFAVAYSPVRRTLVLDMTHFRAPVEAVWIDPVSGARHKVEGRVANRGAHAFEMPESGEDWALLLR